MSLVINGMIVTRSTAVLSSLSSQICSPRRRRRKCQKCWKKRQRMPRQFGKDRMGPHILRTPSVEYARKKKERKKEKRVDKEVRHLNVRVHLLSVLLVVSLVTVHYVVAKKGLVAGQ